MKEEDVLKFLAAGTHLGGTNLDFQMEQYVYKRKSDGKKRRKMRVMCLSGALLIFVGYCDFTGACKGTAGGL